MWGRLRVRVEAGDGQAVGTTVALSALTKPRSPGSGTGNLIPSALWSSMCAAQDFCKHLSLTFNGSTLSKQTLSSTPALTPSYCCQGQWFPLQSLNYPPWSLTHFLSGEPWHWICSQKQAQEAAAPGSVSPHCLQGDCWAVLLPSHPTLLSRKPSLWVGGHLALPPDLLMCWLPSLAPASHHTSPCPRPQEETLSIPDACSFVDSFSPQLQMVWIHFAKWLCL